MAETQVTRLEPNGGAEIDALARLPRDMAIIKMENDNIMALAAARPRSHASILADIKEQLATYKSFAESAMYAKPVGKMEKCPKCGGKTNYKDFCPQRNCGEPIPQKIARGLSIRAAEAIAAAYKYNRVSSTVTDIDDDKSRLDVSFVDYQDGRSWSESAVLSKFFKKYDGTMSRISDDRFYDVVCRAKLSKMIRECINRVVPPGLRHALEEEADRQLDSFLDDNTVAKAIAQFSTKNVTQVMLEKFFGKTAKTWTKEDRKVLVGIWTGLKDGETTVAELFGDKTPDVADVKARIQEANAKANPQPAESHDEAGVVAMPLEPPPNYKEMDVITRRELWHRLMEASVHVKNDFLRVHKLPDFDPLDPEIPGGVKNPKTLSDMLLWVAQAKIREEQLPPKRGPGRPRKEETLLPANAAGILEEP